MYTIIKTLDKLLSDMFYLNQNCQLKNEQTTSETKEEADGLVIQDYAH